MLSDTLNDAERELQQYQTDYPEIYDDLKAEIDLLRCKMNLLRLKLDNCYATDLKNNPFYQAAESGDIEPHDRFMAGESVEQIFHLKPKKAPIIQATDKFDKCRHNGIKYIDGFGGNEAFLVLVNVKDPLAMFPQTTGDWENDWILAPFDWCEANCHKAWSFGKPFTPKTGYFDWRFFFEDIQDAKAFAKRWDGRLDAMERYGLTEL